MRLRSKSGFTLVELLVVIVIIGILAGLLLPQIAHAIRNARVAGCASNLRSLWAAQFTWAAQHGGPHKMMPSAIGSGFWLKLQEGPNPVVGRFEVFYCPAAGEEVVQGYTSFRGPASNVNRMDDKDPVGADKNLPENNHGNGEGGNVLFKTGDVREYGESEDAWRQAELRTTP